MGTLVLRRLPGVLAAYFQRDHAAGAQGGADGLREGTRPGPEARSSRTPSRSTRRPFGPLPRFAAAWFELGLVHQMLNHTADARKAYREALLADPRFIKPYRQLALLSLNEQRLERGRGGHGPLDRPRRRASFPEAYLSSEAFASLHLSLDWDAAERRAREAGEAGRRIGRFLERATCSARCSSREGTTRAPPSSFASTSRLAEPGPDVERARQMLAQLEAKLGAAPKNDTP